MPDMETEDKKSAGETTEKKIPSVYFVSTIKERCIAAAGALFFLVGAVLISPYVRLAATLICFAMVLAFVGDFLDIVIIGRKKIYRMHFFHFSGVIKRKLITICSTSNGKYGDEIYLYGYGSHMTMLRSKKLWVKLMEIIGIPEDIQKKLDVCEGDLYEEQIAPDMHVRSQRVLIDYLLHSEYYVSVEIHRTLPESFYEEMAENEQPRFLERDDDEDEE
ncbi:MAG: hypothetical protein J6T47_04900 [Lachnospiraceae bacterium]|nr:hypothetical protein [Lachnospiraceae bacterium]